LAEAEPQLRSPRRQAPAEVTGIGWYWPAPKAFSRPCDRAVHLIHGHHNHLDFTCLLPSRLSGRAAKEEGLSGLL
jgi:hypothetical protein